MTGTHCIHFNGLSIFLHKYRSMALNDKTLIFIPDVRSGDWDKETVTFQTAEEAKIAYSEIRVSLGGDPQP